MINVLLKTLTPYHSSAPGADYVSLDGKFGRKGPGMFPCVRTRAMPVIVRGEDASTKRVYVPIMPANSLRHVIRANILSDIIDAFRDKYTLSADAYAAAWCGNASGNPEGIAATFAEISAVQMHPFLGLFGGGPRMIEGKISVDNAWAWPQDAATMASAYADYTNPSQVTDIVWKRRVDPIAKIGEDNVQVIANGVMEVTQWCARALEKKEEGAEEEKSRGLQAFNAHEVVIPGVYFAWAIDFKRKPTQQQLAAVLWAIQKMNGMHIGGGSALGYGKVEVADVMLDGNSIWAGGIDERYTDPWIECLDNIEPAAFESFAKKEGN